MLINWLTLLLITEVWTSVESFLQIDQYLASDGNSEKRVNTKFYVYWNAPTFQCAPNGISFNNISQQFPITQNKGDSFRGDKITILYDPGFFPALLRNSTSKTYFYRNGGVPQQGDLEKHMQIFRKQMDELIPNNEFSGLGIIDFESWRPVFRQNFGTLAPYRDVSIEIERQKHPFWPNVAVTQLATYNFEKGAQLFMENTLNAAKQLRPNASWGYYAYPYCFNMNGNQQSTPECPTPVPKENDDIEWLFEASDVLFPSVYLSKINFNTEDRQQLINGRIIEAKRVAAKQSRRPKLVLYFWYKYRDTNDFLSKEDLYLSLKAMKKANINGVVLWGSSNDVNTKQKCRSLHNYVKNILGPIIAEITQ